MPTHENNKPELPTRVRLRADLLKNYDKMVHPVVNLTDNVIVSFKKIRNIVIIIYEDQGRKCNDAQTTNSVEPVHNAFERERDINLRL